MRRERDRPLDVAEERDVRVADRDVAALQRRGGEREPATLAGAADRDRRAVG